MFSKFSLKRSALFVLVASIAINASALENDPALNRLCVPVSPQEMGSSPGSILPCGKTPVPDSQSFRSLAKEYGVALGPQLSSPAKTLGINGFQFDLQFAVTSINKNEYYWQQGIDDRTPESQLVVSRVGLKKGLSASLELGTDVAYLIGSEMWTLGGYAKWGIHEMMDDFPINFSVKGSVSKTVGSAQLQLSMYGADVIVGKTFGLGGVVTVSPYLAYSPLWVVARSGILDSAPVEPNIVGQFVLPQESINVQRFGFGTRFVTGLFSFTPEFVLADNQQTITVNLGLNF